ncbi:MAG: hypothetical protein RRC34_14480 [Lentisphaeria bacterium]|nr:hypothetical protein [Lentisphaeria bacterium]
MTNLKMKDGHLSASFSFPAEFIGFQGHFPDAPVLPGICMIQAFLVMHAAHRGRDFRLNTVLAAKFTGVIGVDQACVFTLAERAGKAPGEHRLTGVIQRQGEQVATLKLLVTAETEK